MKSQQCFIPFLWKLLRGDRGREEACLQEISSRNHHHEPVRELLYFFLKSVVGLESTTATTATTNTSTSFQRVRNEHSVICEELASLTDVAAAATE